MMNGHSRLADGTIQLLKKCNQLVHILVAGNGTTDSHGQLLRDLGLSQIFILSQRLIALPLVSPLCFFYHCLNSFTVPS